MIGSESSPGLKYELNYGMIGNRGDEMRLDKYLKVARILKRRTVSKDLADHQRVLTVRVTETAQYTRKEDAASMYEVVEEKRVELE